MIRPIQPSLILSALLACSISCSARAQVTSNLDNLPGAAPAPHTEPAARSEARALSRPATHPPPRASSSDTPQNTASTAIPPVPPAPPPPVVLPPPFVPIALHPPTPPEPIKADPGARSSTQPLPNDGLRVAFARNSSALDAPSLRAVENFGYALREHPERRALLLAYASMPGDDMSTPRRIALARALAIRSVLINAGVATTRIYPRAIGRTPKADTAPADRLDIVVQTNPSPAASPAPTLANGTPAPQRPQKRETP